MRNAISIDIEEWHHAELVRAHVSPERQKAQVVAATRPILALLDKFEVKATFFVLGQVAQESPEFIREIYARGHEIGCHGMSHRMLTQLGPEELCTELADFGQLMEECGIEGVRGFRAPTFSLEQRTAWAISILDEFGYTYDSSIFPMRGPLYGVPGAPLSPYPISSENIAQPAGGNGRIWEFPMSVWTQGPLRVPVSGGVYLRLLPLLALQAMLREINRQGRPFVLYLHPWETFLDTPQIGEISPLAKWATYVNMGSVLAKLEQLLEVFSFGTLGEVLQRWQANLSSASRIE